MKPYYYSVSPDSLAGNELDQLLALGWYRMHQYLFTCSHLGIEEPHRVHWLRYATSEIKEHASHRKIRKRNKNFRVSIEDFNALREDHQLLHMRYRSSIDFEGAWSIEDCLFGEDFTKNIFDTKCISIFDQDTLIAGGYFDLGERAAASILHFFDPAYRKYSLGKYLILLTIDYLKLHGYDLYYPGYVVEEVAKMNYKLFLGKEQAQYFDPLTIKWKYFEESILRQQPE